MLKFFLAALTVLSASSAFAGDAKIACSTGKTFDQAQSGISLSAASYARAGYRVSQPAIRHAEGRILMCISVSRE